MGKHRQVIALLAALWAAPAFAHHSAIAEYDLAKPVKVSGTVTRVEWTNRTSGSTST